MEAVGLDGRVINLGRKPVLAELRASLIALGVSPEETDAAIKMAVSGDPMRETNARLDDPYGEVVDMDEYWKAWDRLPPEVRHWASEYMPGDENAIELLHQWELAKARGWTIRKFFLLLEAACVNYLNGTRSMWPNPPPEYQSLPRLNP